MDDPEGKELDKYLRAISVVIGYLRDNPGMIDTLIEGLEKLKNETKLDKL